jgi:hypothetical protein
MASYAGQIVGGDHVGPVVRISNHEDNMILQCRDEFDAVMDLDRATGRSRIRSKRQRPGLSETQISGSYSIVNQTPACLYRSDGALYFRFNSEA